MPKAVQNAVQMNGTNPAELADAMRKMEECLQVFAQLSGGGGAPPGGPPKIAGVGHQPTQNQQQSQHTNPAQLRNNCLSPTSQSRSVIFKKSQKKRK